MKPISVPYSNTAPFLVEKTECVIWISSKTAEYWLKQGNFAVKDLPEDLSYSFSPKLIWNNRSNTDPLHQWVRSLFSIRMR